MINKFQKFIKDKWTKNTTILKYRWGGGGGAIER